MTVIRKFLFFLPLCIVLNHCASKQFAHHEHFSARSEMLLKIPTWQSRGKMGLTFSHEGKPAGVSASFEWQQQGDEFLVRFYGPLGMGEVILEKLTAHTVLTNHQGRKFYAQSPEALFLEHTGMEVPWTLISFWLRGIPAPEPAYVLKEFDEQGFPVTLLQSEWRVSYLSWKEFDGIVMPNKIQIARDDMQATLVIRDWNFVSQGKANGE